MSETTGGDNPQNSNPNNNRAANGWRNALSALGNATLAFNTGIPRLSELTRSTEGVSNAFKFLEQGLAGLQGFSSFGVDFNMSISTMITAATKARMSLPELADAVSQNSQNLLRLGGTVDQGLQRFLNAQEHFYRRMPEAANNLQMLGFSVQEINDTFLQYDAISRITNRNDRRTQTERNRAATEFAQELDKLARLTGIERKALAEKIQENLREGNVLATEANLRSRFGDDIADSFNTTLASFSSFGTGIENLTSDILTRGFPVGQSKLIASLAPELLVALRAAKAAQDVGDLEGFNRAMADAAVEAAKLNDSNRINRLALLTGYNEIGDAAGNIRVGVSQGMARAIMEVADAAEAAGESLTGQEIMNRARAKVEQEQLDNMARNGQTAEGSLAQLLIRLNEAVANGATAAQEEILKEIETQIRGAAGNTSDYIRNIQPAVRDFFRDLNTGFTELFTFFGIQNRTSADILAGAQSIIQRTQNIEDPTVRNKSATLAGLISDYETLMQGNPTEQANAQTILDQIRTQSIELTGMYNRLQPSIDLNNLSIGNAEVTITGTANIRGVDGSATGTLGTTGRLFRNFGKEQLMFLHGVESVQTPEQTAAIMRYSALGALQAVGDILNAGFTNTDEGPNIADIQDRLAGNATQSLQGMLNTVRDKMNTMAPEREINVDFSQLTTAMQDVLVRGFKSQEDVIKELREPLERVAVASAESVNVQNRVRKGIKGLSGDMMKGIG